jgi:hypothetical protein
MSDYQLVAYQASAIRIGNDPAHAKHAFARRALPLIEGEIRRRTEAERPTKTEPNA